MSRGITSADILDRAALAFRRSSSSAQACAPGISTVDTRCFRSTMLKSIQDFSERARENISQYPDGRPSIHNLVNP